MVRIVTTGDSISTLKLVRLRGPLRKALFAGTTKTMAPGMVDKCEVRSGLGRVWEPFWFNIAGGS